MQKAVSILFTGLFLAPLFGADLSLREVKIFKREGDAVHCDGSKSPSIDICLQSLIDNKKESEQLRIIVTPGTYPMHDSVILYKKNNIELIGGGTSPSEVTLELKSTYRTTSAKSNASYFTFLSMDSHDLRFSGFHFKADPNLSGQRGFGFCGLNETNLSGFSIDHMKSSGFAYIFAIFGRPMEDSHFAELAIAGPEPLKSEILKLPVEKRVCQATFKDVTFSDNDLSLRDVALYYVPYSLYRTKSDTTHIPGTPITANTVEWRKSRDKITQESTGFKIERNRFQADPSFPDQSDTPFHSFIKLHYTEGARIAQNIFNAGKTRVLFSNGGMLNLAAGMKNTIVEKNQFLMDKNSKAKHQMVSVQSSFLTHPSYGLGSAKLFPPIEGILFDSNRYDLTSSNGVTPSPFGPRLFDCCLNELAKRLNTIVCSAFSEQYPPNSGKPENTVPYCKEADANALDAIQLRNAGNTKFFYVSSEKKDHPCYPGLVYCRKNVAAKITP